VTLPALARGAARAQKPIDDIVIHHSAMVAAGRSASELAAARQAIRKQLAFYGSTPAYWPILELHDRAELGPRLKGMSKSGEWDRMAELIDDDFLDAVAITATDPARAAAQLHERYDGIVGRLGFNTPYRVDPTLLTELLREW
jgi:hypothetical protein